MHAQNKDLFAKYKQMHAYETVMELRDEGKFAISAFPSTIKPRFLIKSSPNIPKLKSSRFSLTTSITRTPP